MPSTRAPDEPAPGGAVRIYLFEGTWHARRSDVTLLVVLATLHLTLVGTLAAAGSGQTFLDNALPLLPPLVAAALVIRESRQGEATERLGLVALLGFVVLREVGRLFYGIDALSAPDGTVNLADGLAIACWALAVAAVLLLAPSSDILDGVRALDVAVVVIVALSLAGEYVVPLAVAGPRDSDSLLGLGNPLISLAILAFLVASFTGEAGGARVRTLLLSGAWALLAIADVVHATGEARMVTGALTVASLCSSWMLVLAVVAGDDASIAIDRRDQRLVVFAQTALPFGLLAPLVVLVGAGSLAGDPVPVLTIGTFGAALLLLGRQWLLAASSRDLYAHRERLVLSLNEKTLALEREILDRRRAETALRRSEERFRAVAEHLDEGLFLTSPVGRIVYSNPTMASFNGYERSEFLGRRASDVLEPWEGWSAILEEARASPEAPPTRHELSAYTDDGRQIWLEGYGRSFREEGEEEAGVIGIAIDITDRKVAEQETRARAEELSRHNAALERLSSSTAFSREGPEAALHEIADVAASALPGMAVSIWLIDGERSILREVARKPAADTPLHRGPVDLSASPAYAAALASERVIAIADTRLDNRLAATLQAAEYDEDTYSVLDAPVRLLGDTVGIIRCERGGSPHAWTAAEESLFVSLAGFAATVLEAKKRQEALLESARLAAVLGATPDYVAIWDADGRALYVNESARELLGIGPGADLAAISLESFHPADTAARLREAAIPESFATGHWSGESVVVAPNGHRVPVSQVILAHDSGDTRYLATIMRDLSESRRATEEREKLNQKLQEAQKLESLGLLAGGIAHDFNNLLQAILGNAQIARMAIVPGATTAHESLAELETAAFRAGDLVRQLLAFAGGGRTGVSPTNPSGLVEETVRLLLAVVTRHATLDLDLASDLPLVEADPVQLRQVVMNLITNAADAIGETGGSITVRTRSVHLNRAALRECYLGETLPGGPYVSIEVQDTGVGMDGSTLARIFDPFFTTKNYGHGLGLAAVLGIVRSHGGAVRVESEPGQGTTFAILLPPVRADARGDLASTEPAAA